ncbi:MAG: DUF4982 domain-containing protein, partial [Lachnospiraceae bacterium]|nr:DUF4982 domain-containing protein [Lachnospiraceae bacterium]
TFAKYSLEASADELLSGSYAHLLSAPAPVDIPHDWLIGQVNNLYEDSIGCYRKHFTVPTADHAPEKSRFFLRFEGVYMDSRCYINGREVFAWPYGYTTFEFEITPYLINGDNELVVTVTYQSPNTRWYSGAGIYRNVWLLGRCGTYLVSDGIYASAEPACEAMDENGVFPGENQVTIDTEIAGDYADEVLLRQTLRDADGQVVAADEAAVLVSEGQPDGNRSMSQGLQSDAVAAACAEGKPSGARFFNVHSQTLSVSDAHAWDITSPVLYELTTELLLPGGGTEAAVLLDSYTQKIGFRSVRLDPSQGFYLNGRHVKLKGACMHHDLGALGAAVNKTATKRQLLSLLSMGCNAVRTSHNPPSFEFMDLCDELGILVDSEAFDMWELHKTEYDYSRFFKDHWKADVRSWIRRDRNHPSVFFWSIGNEIYDTHGGDGLRITKELRDAVRELDYRHHAFVTIGSNYVAWDGAQQCADELEASGYNYLERLYDGHHNKYPHWCIYGSETSSTVQSRGVYHFPADVRLLTFADMQCSSLSNCSTNWGAKNPTVVITGDRDTSFSLGQFIWTGWDYIGEPTPYHTKNSYFGQCDTAGFPKDSYYIYQAGWTDAKTHPMVHIVPYWDFNVGQMIDVQVFSNCPKVELFKDGVSLGTRDIDPIHGKELHGSWLVPYAPGELYAVAYDAAGNIAATDRQCSFKDPAEIILTPDKRVLQADGEDMTFLTVTLNDADGRPVHNARNRMNITVSGAARLVGLDNGDSTDYDEYKGTSRRLFSGKLLLMLMARKEPGEITVKVTSAGLPDAELKLQVVTPSYGKCSASAGSDAVFNSTGNASDCSAVCASFENSPRITDPAVLNEVPVRKIALTISRPDSDSISGKLSAPAVLTPDCRELVVSAELFPANTTFRDITFRVLTKDGIDSAAIRVTPREDGRSALVTALGDEETCYLYAFAANGKPHADVISSLELQSEGLGRATVDPYAFVNAIRYNASNQKPTLSFDGGAFTADEPTWVRYDNIDFGDYGSNTITIPIFSFSDVVPIEVWEGTPGEGELLFRGQYEAKSIYNTYQSNTFKLSKRLRGVTSLSILVPFKLSLHGFVFTHIDKAWAEIGVTELVHASGDAYRIEKDGICGISNNVDLGFGPFDFGERGARSITVTGRSHAPQCTIHLHFTKDGNTETQIIDIPKTSEAETFTYAIEPVYGACTVNFIFLPGTDFDLKSFRFD